MSWSCSEIIMAAEASRHKGVDNSWNRRFAMLFLQKIWRYNLREPTRRPLSGTNLCNDGVAII